MRKIDARFLNTQDTCPIVAIDIDGVLNYFGRGLSTDVKFRIRKIGPYKIVVRTDMLEILEPLLQAEREGRVTLAWGTMWEDKARDDFAPLCLNGVGSDWPVIYFSTPAENLNFEQRKAFQESQRRRSSLFCFKTPGIAEFSHAINRQVIWLDDMIDEWDQRYLENHAEENLSLYAAQAVTVPEDTGLTHEIVDHVVNTLVPRYEEQGLLI